MQTVNIVAKNAALRGITIEHSSGPVTFDENRQAVVSLEAAISLLSSEQVTASEEDLARVEEFKIAKASGGEVLEGDVVRIQVEAFANLTVTLPGNRQTTFDSNGVAVVPRVTFEESKGSIQDLKLIEEAAPKEDQVAADKAADAKAATAKSAADKAAVTKATNAKAAADKAAADKAADDGAPTGN